MSFRGLDGGVSGNEKEETEKQRVGKKRKRLVLPETMPKKEGRGRKKPVVSYQTKGTFAEETGVRMGGGNIKEKHVRGGGQKLRGIATEPHKEKGRGYEGTKKGRLTKRGLKTERKERALHRKKKGHTN